MHRRDWLKSSVFGSGAIGLPWLVRSAFGADDKPVTIAEEAARGTPPLRITDIKTFLTAPAKIRLVVVKVMTNEPGLYGLGCATFTQRARAVETAVETFLKPFLIGKDVTRIEDIFRQFLLAKRTGVRKRALWRGYGSMGHPWQTREVTTLSIVGRRMSRSG